MKTLVTVLIPVLGLSLAAGADDLSIRAWQLETKGDGTGARELLEQAAQRGAADALEAYAQFLDRHRDPAAREAYEKALKVTSIWSLATAARPNGTWNNFALQVDATSIFPRHPRLPLQPGRLSRSPDRFARLRAWRLSRPI